jgi:hypothetical protein
VTVRIAGAKVATHGARRRANPDFFEALYQVSCREA